MTPQVVNNQVQYIISPIKSDRIPIDFSKASTCGNVSTQIWFQVVVGQDDRNMSIISVPTGNLDCDESDYNVHMFL